MSMQPNEQRGLRLGGPRRWRPGRTTLVVMTTLVLLAAVVGYALLTRYAPNRPVTYSTVEEHFKYGSIGSDIETGLPVKILMVLPRMFPEYLPEGAPQDLTAFGFIQEPGQPLPIGFSMRRRIVDVAGFNCAFCHVGVVRESPEADPAMYLGMPSNTVDLLAFSDFLIAAVNDPRFNAEDILAALQQDESLNAVDRVIYRLAIPRMRDGLLERQKQQAAFMPPGHPRFGPGRIDTFNSYKTNHFAEYYPDGVPDEERIGTADFPSIWNQSVREGMNLHWDGNNTSVRERNFSAAFGAGATRENIDSAAIDRIKVWIDALQAPPYPFARANDPQVLARGQQVFEQACASCHALTGDAVGQVVPIAEIGTDPGRLNSYTEKLAGLQLAYGKGYDWEFKSFRKTEGYANSPLDGIWARAPYLHNGSVPTMWDLLTPEAQRNNGQTTFYAGHGVYDSENMGFRTDVDAINGRPSFLFDTTLPGNGNQGHTGERYGTELSDEDKRALIEYLKGY